MVKSNKQPRPQPATECCSVSVNGSVNYMEHTFCVVLHVVEAINFHGREMREGEREQIIMNAALNTIDFEVEGTPSVTAETIIFNSNCIWECDLAGIKRIKTDHRPVKITFFSASNAERKVIGSLLLPVRGLPVLGTGGNNSALQLKMFWHKLICTSNEFRSHKPEVLLMLAIIKKSLLHTKDFKHLMAFTSSEKESHTPPLQSPGHSITANMLQSQANVYVQSLVQLGLLQVGNDPLVDCDIIEVVLQFKQLNNLNKFVKSLHHGKDAVDTVLLMFDFVGNITNINLKLNNMDSYTLNDILGLRFKSSLRSIRLYFQRIFYLPINMYINGTSIANYRMDFGKLLPPDSYFADRRKYVHSDCFAFERFGRMGTARDLKPVMDFTFTVEIQEVYWRQQQEKEPPLQQQQHDEQLGLQSVGSKAVIHEVPKDRAQDNVLGWKRNSENQSVSAHGSVNSLNVGTELSVSDERDTGSESHLSDAPDSDAPATVHTSQQRRRRKFSRLIVNNPELDDGDEKGGEEEHTYASKVVSGQLLPSNELDDEQLQDDDFMDLPDDIGSDSELYALYSSGKLKKTEKCLPRRAEVLKELREHKPNNLSASVPSRAARSEKRNPTEIASQRSLKASHVDDRTKFLREQTQLREHTTKSVDEYEFDDRMADDSSAELEQENEKMAQQVPKEGRARHAATSKPVEELTTQKEPTTASKARKSRWPALSADADDVDPNVTNLSQDQNKKAIKKNLPIDDATGTKSKIIRKKKSFTKTEEFEASELFSPMPRKPMKSSKAATEKQNLASQDSLDAVEPDLDFASEEPKHLSRVDPGKKLRNKVRSPLDMETNEVKEFLQRPSMCKMKSKPSLPVEADVSDTALTKKVSKTKKIHMSKTDLSLSARWVEVSRAQTKALNETEEYIEATCNAELENSSFAGEPAERPKKSIANKLQRSSRTVQRKNIEYMELNFGTEMKPRMESSLVEESFRESKIERKVLKKKNPAQICPNQDSMEPENSAQMETSLKSHLVEESFKESKIERKVLKKKRSTQICPHQDSMEPEKNAEVEPSLESSLESLKEAKIEQKVLKKKKSAQMWQVQDSMELQNNSDRPDQNAKDPQKKSEMEPSLERSLIEEESFREPKPNSKTKGPNKKMFAEICQDEIVEPQINQLRPKSSRTKELIHQETERVTSEMESMGLEPSSIRKHEKKTRRVVKKSSLQSYLDAEEAAIGNLPQNTAEPVSKRSVKVAPLKTPEVASSDLESIGRRQVLKKKTEPAANKQSEPDLIGSVCGSHKKNVAKSQLELDALVSRLEVTVHMYDQTKVAASTSDQGVNTDIKNLDENIKQVLVAGKKLQDELQRCAVENPGQSQDNLVQSDLTKQSSYGANLESKITELEQDMTLLKQENSKLVQEKMELKERIAKMDRKIAELCQQANGSNEMQQVLSEMRMQNVLYLDMTKTKDRYKKQWRRCAKRVHALKLAMYEKNVQLEYKNMPSNELNLKTILTQDAAEFEREYGRFRRSDKALSFSGSGESPEPVLKDYHCGLSSQTMHQQRPANHVDGTRMH